MITTLENKISFCFLLPNPPAFHLMYSPESHCRVGGFTTVLSLLSSAQSLLSNSSLFCLSFPFLDPQCAVNRSQRWVGVSTSCHLTGTPLISPMWQLCLPPNPYFIIFLDYLPLSRIFTVTGCCVCKEASLSPSLPSFSLLLYLVTVSLPNTHRLDQIAGYGPQGSRKQPLSGPVRVKEIPKFWMQQLLRYYKVCSYYKPRPLLRPYLSRRRRC